MDIAKNIIATNLTKRCKAPFFLSAPFPIKVDTFDTSNIDKNLISLAVKKYFALSPKRLINALNLKSPTYKKTDKVNQLIDKLKK